MKETTVNINKTKSWFVGNLNIIDKPLARLIKKEREKNQINKIRNEKGVVTTDNAETQRNIRDYYEQSNVNKIDNLEEMDRLLQKFNLPRLSQEEIEIMKDPITSIDFEAVIKNLPKNKSPEPDGRRILSNIQPDSSRKKEKRIKSTKLEMKEDRLQETMQKYKGI